MRELYQLAFGHRIQENQPLWEPFIKHIKRRNDIVHRGDVATAQGAGGSVAAVDKVIQHLLQSRP